MYRYQETNWTLFCYFSILRNFFFRSRIEWGQFLFQYELFQ